MSFSNENNISRLTKVNSCLALVRKGSGKQGRFMLSGIKRCPPSMSTRITSVCNNTN